MWMLYLLMHSSITYEKANIFLEHPIGIGQSIRPHESFSVNLGLLGWCPEKQKAGSKQRISLICRYMKNNPQQLTKPFYMYAVYTE
jgi:hypothetical protein